MNRRLSTRLGRIGAGMAVALLSLSAGAQITFYEDNDFLGRSFNTASDVADFRSAGFNDRASSVVVLRERWQVCEGADFTGRCQELRPGVYTSLLTMGLNDRISSVRRPPDSTAVQGGLYTPETPYRSQTTPQPQYREPVVPGYDARRRGNERLFKARVLSTRAVVGEPEQRCWVEPGQASQSRGSASVPGGVIGAVLGGILGHQIGGGSGRDVATAVGVLGGAAVGANVGRERGQAGTADVTRCVDRAPQSNARPAYWDVSYIHRGQEHRVQTSAPPGAFITVNRFGEPRL